MGTNYERGRRYEYKSMEILRDAGYAVSRAAGSHGPWDVMGSSTVDLLFVQVKYNCTVSKAEFEQFALYPVPTCARKLIHTYYKGTRKPVVTLVASLRQEAA